MRRYQTVREIQRREAIRNAWGWVILIASAIAVGSLFGYAILPNLLCT